MDKNEFAREIAPLMKQIEKRMAKHKSAFFITNAKKDGITFTSGARTIG